MDRKNVGIRERHIAAKDQATSDLAVAAGIRAIKDAGLSNKDIDLIIVDTGTPDRPCPLQLALCKRNWGFSSGGFDISAVCAGFIYGFSVAASLIISGNYEKY